MAGTQTSESDRRGRGWGGPSTPTHPTGAAAGKRLLRRLDLQPPRGPRAPRLRAHARGHRQVLTELEHRRLSSQRAGTAQRGPSAGQGQAGPGREMDTQAKARGGGGQLQPLPTAPENAFSWEPACLPLAPRPTIRETRSRSSGERPPHSSLAAGPTGRPRLRAPGAWRSSPPPPGPTPDALTGQGCSWRRR